MAKDNTLWRNDPDDDRPPQQGDAVAVSARANQFRLTNEDMERLCRPIAPTDDYKAIEGRLTELQEVNSNLLFNSDRIASQLDAEEKNPTREGEWFERAQKYEEILERQGRRIYATIRYVQNVLYARRQAKKEGAEPLRNARRDYVYFAVQRESKLFDTLGKEAAEQIREDNQKDWDAVIKGARGGLPTPSLPPIIDDNTLNDGAFQLKYAGKK